MTARFAALPFRIALAFQFVVAGAAMFARPVAGQGRAVRGIVVRASDGRPLTGATVTVVGAGLSATTGLGGQFVIYGAAGNAIVLRAQLIGYAPTERTLDLTADVAPLSIGLQERPVLLADLLVTSVSRVPERQVSAPGAVSTLDLSTASQLAISGQPALALATLPGVDVVQTDVQDFSINAHGFNVALNRRILVLQDGRDLAISFLGSQEWAAMSATLDDMSHVEFVRGPSAALYGANAFAGVLNLTTAPARDTPGSRMTFSAGELGSLRVDARHGGLAHSGRWAYRVGAGYSRSDAWSRSRTNIGDLKREYGPAIDTLSNTITSPFPGFEAAPLHGQATGAPIGMPAAATGSPSPLTTAYGTARLDYYAPNGSVFTAEGGDAETRNELLLGGAARFQVGRSSRPWFRLGWAADQFHLMAWYSGRTGRDQMNLAAGTPSVDLSHTLHVEGQFNRQFAGNKGRVVAGASWRLASVNTEGTLVAPEYDARTDHYYGVFGQAEYTIAPKLRAVLAGRLDASNLFAAQLSPKAALVYDVAPRQSVRLTFGRAFQMPNSLDFFVSVPAGAPADFTGIESALRASSLGPALANVPNGQLFTNSASVPILALGNPDLDVEHVTSYEAGYKAQFGRAYITVDGYYSVMDKFVSDVLPGVNPTYAPWTAPSTVTEANRPAVETAVQDILNAAGQGFAAAGLTRLPGGNTAVVFSVGNAGKAEVRGVDVAVAISVTPQWRIDANYSLFGFHLESSSFVPGAQVLPNTPRQKGNVTVAYRGARGFGATLSAHLASAFQWAYGTYAGPVPSAQTINATAAWQVTPAIQLQAAATNVLGQRRYQSFGGAVIGRRVLAGVTARF